MYTNHSHFLSTHSSHFSGKKVRTHSGEKNEKFNCATKIKKSTFFHQLASKKIKKSEKKTSTNVTPYSEASIDKKICSKNLASAHFTIFQTSFKFHDEVSNEVKQNEQNKKFMDPILARFQREEILTTPKHFLENHDISKNLRSRILDWMIELLFRMKTNDHTFFLSSYILDRYIEKSASKISPLDMHLIGLTCIFIASKYEEASNHLTLSMVHEDCCSGKYTKEQIKNQELIIMETINFQVFVPNIFTIMEIIMRKININNQFEKRRNNLVHKILMYMCKMALYDYDIISAGKYFLLTASISLVAFKLVGNFQKDFNISKNIKIIKNLFDLDENEIIMKSNEILHLAKNFDTLFQHTKNLRLVNNDLFEELREVYEENKKEV